MNYRYSLEIESNTVIKVGLIAESIRVELIAIRKNSKSKSKIKNAIS